VPVAIGLTVDRAKLQATLPDSFVVDSAATPDPTKARQTIVRLKLADGVPVRMVMEESLAGAGDLIVSELRDNEVPLALEVQPVGNLVESFPALVESGVDLVFASQETADSLAELHAGELTLPPLVL